MRRTAIKLGVVAFGAAALLAVGVGQAGAHTAAVHADCATGVTVTATSYAVQDGKTNTAVVKLDEQVVAENGDFGGAFNATVPNPDPTKAHAWSVDITAWDSSTFDVHQSGTIPACSTPTTTTTPPTTTTTTPPRPVPPAPIPPPAPPVKAPAHFTG